MWQGLRIGAHIPTSVGGGDQSMFGLAWLSLKVREIKPMGLDFAHINEYDYSEFDLRMRVVRGVSPNQKPTQQIKPLGLMPLCLMLLTLKIVSISYGRW
jgi:hypothetical protein